MEECIQNDYRSRGVGRRHASDPSFLRCEITDRAERSAAKPRSGGFDAGHRDARRVQEDVSVSRSWLAKIIVTATLHPPCDRVDFQDLEQRAQQSPPPRQFSNLIPAGDGASREGQLSSPSVRSARDPGSPNRKPVAKTANGIRPHQHADLVRAPSGLSRGVSTGRVHHGATYNC